jgi:hypothetical protein
MIVPQTSTAPAVGVISGAGGGRPARREAGGEVEIVFLDVNVRHQARFTDN